MFFPLYIAVNQKFKKQNSAHEETKISIPVSNTALIFKKIHRKITRCIISNTKDELLSAVWFIGISLKNVSVGRDYNIS